MAMKTKLILLSLILLVSTLVVFGQIDRGNFLGSSKTIPTAKLERVEQGWQSYKKTNPTCVSYQQRIDWTNVKINKLTAQKHDLDTRNMLEAKSKGVIKPYVPTPQSRSIQQQINTLGKDVDKYQATIELEKYRYMRTVIKK